MTSHRVTVREPNGAVDARSGAWRRVRRRFEDGCRDGGRRYVVTTGYSVVLDGGLAVT